MALCNDCPRKCNIDRNIEKGVCGMGNTARVALTELHYWEEPIISGNKGSGAIFFSGCNLKCVYCQNYELSRGGKGIDYSIEELADAFKRLEDAGAHNVNLVTPDHYVTQIKKALDIYRPNIPVCYNTSGYCDVDTIISLDDYIDIFLTDIKYSDGALASTYSKAGDYVEKANQAALIMRRMKADIIEDGIMKQGVIIRHLVLPGALANSIGVIDWLSAHMDRHTIVSLMSQYTPMVDKGILSKRIKPLEYKILCDRLLKAGFENSYIQDTDSSSVDYVPNFFGEPLYEC